MCSRGAAINTRSNLLLGRAGLPAVYLARLAAVEFFFALPTRREREKKRDKGRCLHCFMLRGSGCGGNRNVIPFIIINLCVCSLPVVSQCNALVLQSLFEIVSVKVEAILQIRFIDLYFQPENN